MTVIDLMTLSRFEALIDAYGARPEAWPEAERAAAQAFAQAHPRARAILEMGAQLDAALAIGDAQAPSRALEDRIMAGFKAHQRGRRAAPMTWVQAGAVAATVLVSVTAGWMILRPHSAVDLSDDQAWEVLGDDLEIAAVQTPEPPR